MIADDDAAAKFDWAVAFDVRNGRRNVTEDAHVYSSCWVGDRDYTIRDLPPQSEATVRVSHDQVRQI